MRPRQNGHHLAEDILWNLFSSMKHGSKWIQISLKFVLMCPINNKPALLQVMARLKAITWWRHQMETFSALLAICAGNSPVPGEFPSQRPVTRSFDVFFDLRPNKRLSKQSWGWWFETLSRPLWRHRNDLNYCCVSLLTRICVMRPRWVNSIAINHKRHGRE